MQKHPTSSSQKFQNPNVFTTMMKIMNHHPSQYILKI